MHVSVCVRERERERERESEKKKLFRNKEYDRYFILIEKCIIA